MILRFIHVFRMHKGFTLENRRSPARVAAELDSNHPVLSTARNSSIRELEVMKAGGTSLC